MRGPQKPAVWLKHRRRMMPRPRFPQALAAGGEKKPGPWTDRVRAHAVAAAGAVSPLGERIVDGLLPAPTAAAAADC